jgi:pimeloyl-ACP methyl ester carboxylesterase
MKAIVRLLFNAIARSPAVAAFASIVLAAALAAFVPPVNAQGTDMNKPTVLLVHGAFADSSSWDVVTAKLLGKGYTVVAVAIPLRGVKSDAS